MLFTMVHTLQFYLWPERFHGPEVCNGIYWRVYAVKCAVFCFVHVTWCLYLVVFTL
jgi:hypothetical protein